MKTGIFVAAFWATVALSYSSTFAQDTNRVPDIIRGLDAVDASAHSDVVERALREPQPSQEPVKLPATYSRWVLNSSDRPPATQYWPDHPKDTTSTAAPGDSESPSPLSSPSFQAGRQLLVSTVWSVPSSDPTTNLASDINPGKPQRKPGLFNSLAIGRTQNSPTDPQRLKTIRPPLSPQPQADGFSTPFRAVQFGVTNTSSQPYPFSETDFPSKRAGEKQQKRLPQQKLADGNRISAIRGFSNDHRKLTGSRLTAKTK
jgi:hypothetical protein